MTTPVPQPRLGDPPAPHIKAAVRRILGQTTTTPVERLDVAAFNSAI